MNLATPPWFGSSAVRSPALRFTLIKVVCATWKAWAHTHNSGFCPPDTSVVPLGPAQSQLWAAARSLRWQSPSSCASSSFCALVILSSERRKSSVWPFPCFASWTLVFSSASSSGAYLSILMRTLSRFATAFSRHGSSSSVSSTACSLLGTSLKIALRVKTNAPMRIAGPSSSSAAPRGLSAASGSSFRWSRSLPLFTSDCWCERVGLTPISPTGGTFSCTASAAALSVSLSCTGASARCFAAEALERINFKNNQFTTIGANQQSTKFTNPP